MAELLPSDPIAPEEEPEAEEEAYNSQVADLINEGRQKAERAIPTEPPPRANPSSSSTSGSRQGAFQKRAQQALSEGGKRAGQALKKTAKKIATAFIERNPWVWGAVGITVLGLIVIAVIVAGVCLSGLCGSGGSKTASNQADVHQVTLLASLTGDKIANTKTVQQIVNDEKDRYSRIKKNAGSYSPELSTAVQAKIDEFTPLLDSLISTQAKEERIKIKDDVQKKMLDFEATLPFGLWTSKYAEDAVHEGSLKFCVITKVSANVACASVVSTLLWQSGVPDAIVPTTTEVWNNHALRTIVDRPANKSADTYTANSAKLQKGDVIWWGDGSCSSTSYPGKLFDHIGIFDGDNQAIDNSSSKSEVLRRSAASRDSCRVFNGAKRYGKDL